MVRKFLERVKLVPWRARLSFLQTQEGAVALICSGAFLLVAAYTLDPMIFAEAFMILPFHFVAWYISFRMPRAEQLRAIAKVQECLQRFVSSEDAFTSHRNLEDACQHEMMPPSSCCVSVLRDKAWRLVPYNLIVEGDIFKLQEGGTFPCKARLLTILPQGAVHAKSIFEAGRIFQPAETINARPFGATISGASSFAGANSLAREATPVVCCFRALSTACVPTVDKFLQTAQRVSEGRMDTVFFELAAVVRERMKKISFTLFAVTAVVASAWMAQPAVFEQAFEWQLRRALLPIRLLVCLLPLMPVILLQVTDVWGNARIQSLFEWHAGLADDEKHSSDGGNAEEGTLLVEMDATHVPLHRQLRELIDILRQGLDGPSNLMHTLNSTTVVCFCDKEGLLTDTCTTIAEVCICRSEHPRPEDTAPGDTPAPSSSQPVGSGSMSPTHVDSTELWPGGRGDEAPAPLQARVLDVQAESSTSCGLRFEEPEAEWRRLLPSLKPLGLAMAVSRQPRQLERGTEGAELYNVSVGDLLQAMHRGGSAAMHDCVCNVAKLIGFRDEVLEGFRDAKFCMELCRLAPPADAAAGQVAFAPRTRARSTSGVVSSCCSAPAICDSSRSNANPSPLSGAAGAAPSGVLLAAGSSAPAGGCSNAGSEKTTTSPSRSPKAAVSQPNSPTRQRAHSGQSNISPEDVNSEAAPDGENEAPGSGRVATNFSRTLLTWFVQDSRDASWNMFCKAKPKRLLPKCTHYFNGSKLVKLEEEDRQKLLRLVLQWKASGLNGVAYSYRPLTKPAEIDIPLSLVGHSAFCTTETAPDALDTPVTTGETVESPGGERLRRRRQLEALRGVQGEQVLLGMAALKMCASVQMASYAEALQGAGIRFQVYCAAGEKRTRTLGSHLGLETGWNCLISLEPNRKEFKNMMGQVVLPSGIDNIRRHAKEVDNLPLLVSLFSHSTPWRAQQMISILQENGECVTCVGSALQPNLETFRQANISVSVLVGSVPRCLRCYGLREPRPEPQDREDDELLVSGTVGRAEFQLSADLTSLPCALQARHSYTNGEQRTLGVLYNAIKESRRCVDCILMVLIHYMCGAVELALVEVAQALLCMPPVLEGVHALAILFVLLPSVSLALLFNAASPQIMQELPLKKADEKTLAQPGRIMKLYALRSVPSALVVLVAFLHELHRLFEWQLQEERPWSANISAACDGFSWLWWLSGQWPTCVKAMSDAFHPEGRSNVGPWDAEVDRSLGVRSVSCALAHSQQWSAMLFVIYEVTLAFTFLDRYDSLLDRGPLSNKVLCTVSALALMVHMVVGAAVAKHACVDFGHEMLWPSWAALAFYVGVWPSIAVFVSECSKRRDRRLHVYTQRTLRLLFNTRLGMWSPK